MVKSHRHCCRECLEPLPADRKQSMEFCSIPCRLNWRNRRMSRGAELYDLFMAMRYDREKSKILGVWNLMCRMAQVWNEEDKAAGRQTYFRPEIVVEKNLHLRAEVLVKGKR